MHCIYMLRYIERLNITYLTPIGLRDISTHTYRTTFEFSQNWTYRMILNETIEFLVVRISRHANISMSSLIPGYACIYMYSNLVSMMHYKGLNSLVDFAFYAVTGPLLSGIQSIHVYTPYS